MRAEDIQPGMVLYYAYAEGHEHAEPGCVVRIISVALLPWLHARRGALVLMERADGAPWGGLPALGSKTGTVRNDLLSPLDPGIAALYGIDMKEG